MKGGGLLRARARARARAHCHHHHHHHHLASTPAPPLPHHYPTTQAFYPISPTAALLLGPYTLWLLFASALNWRIWQMNHGGGRPPVDNSDGKGKLRALLLASK